MLDQIDEFVEVLLQIPVGLLDPQPILQLNRSLSGTALPHVGDVYCPGCAAPRRTSLDTLHIPGNALDLLKSRPRTPGIRPMGAADVSRQALKHALQPSLFELTCLQCNGKFAAVVCASAQGPMLAILPSVAGGLRTKHTPVPVAYYLDQAQRCASVGANSAALAMYRGALEQVLYHEGFQSGMLAAKLTSLEAKIQANTAPKWASDLDTPVLNLIKELGNGSIHPNGGDVTKQAAADSELLRKVASMFILLLDAAYEQPERKKATLAALSSAAKTMK